MRWVLLLCPTALLLSLNGVRSASKPSALKTPKYPFLLSDEWPLSATTTATDFTAAMEGTTPHFDVNRAAPPDHYWHVGHGKFYPIPGASRREPTAEVPPPNPPPPETADAASIKTTRSRRPTLRSMFSSKSLKSAAAAAPPVPYVERPMPPSLPPVQNSKEVLEPTLHPAFTDIVVPPRKSSLDSKRSIPRPGMSTERLPLGTPDRSPGELHRYPFGGGNEFALQDIPPLPVPAFGDHTQRHPNQSRPISSPHRVGGSPSLESETRQQPKTAPSHGLETMQQVESMPSLGYEFTQHREMVPLLQKKGGQHVEAQSLQSEQSQLVEIVPSPQDETKPQPITVPSLDKEYRQETSMHLEEGEPSAVLSRPPLRSAMKPPTSFNHDITQTHSYQGYATPVRVYVKRTTERNQPFHYAVRSLPHPEEQTNDALYLRPGLLRYPKPLNQQDFYARRDTPKSTLLQ